VRGAAKNCKKNNKTLYLWSSRFLKVIDVDTTKSLSLGIVVIGSISMPICNHFYGRLANNGKKTTFRGYRFLTPSCAGFLKLQGFDLDRWNLRSMLKTSHAACLGLSVVNSAQFAPEMSRSPKIAKKSINPLYWRSKSFKIKVIKFGANQEPVYDFLLVINSNLGPISHHYWDTAIGKNKAHTI